MAAYPATGNVLEVRTPAPRLPARSELERGFAAIRADLEIEVGFDAEVEARAAAVALEPPTGHPRAGAAPVDRTDLEFVTIDPPTSTDLDQAVHIEQLDDGFLVSYAIADPSTFVAPGDPVDLAAHRRGVTFYCPDTRASLYPAAIGEGAASLLPDVDRPAFLWSMRLDSNGYLVDASVVRAVVRSRAKLSYAAAQAHIDAGTGAPTLALLRTVGELRLAREASRGGVSLNLPSQEVETEDGHYVLRHDESMLVEDWNAQISLLTGMAAADLMVHAGIGVLRTLPDPDEGTLHQIRRAALALGIDWPKDVTYAERIRDIRPDRPEHIALLTAAVRALRGADYVAFDGEIPEERTHWAIAAEYAHVTAPLRRLGDRYTNEIVVAICAGERPPAWVLHELEELPETLREARRRESRLDRAVVDRVEAALLAHRVGERFRATVTARRGDRPAPIQIDDPAIAAVVRTEADPGDVIDVELTAVDVDASRIEFREV